MPAVYVLRNMDGTFWHVGVADNAKYEVRMHKKGKYPETCGQLPLDQVCEEQFDDAAKAQSRADYLKSPAGRRELVELLNRLADPWPGA